MRVKGCSKEGGAGGGEGRKKQNPKNEMGLRILNGVRQWQEGRGTDNVSGEEVRAQSIAPPHHQKKGHNPTGWSLTHALPA